MKPLAHACLGAAVIALLGGPGARTVRARSLEPIARPLPGARGALCSPGALPDGGACVSFLGGDDEGADLQAVGNWHVDKGGRLVSYEQVPRSPERPADYNAYRFPLPPPANGGFLLSGYDLDRPDDAQRRGPKLRAVGHGGVDLVAKRGTEVRLVPLEHQEGDAEVAYVGPLFGTSVVTRHVVREGGRLRTYVVLYGHLDDAAPGLARGAPAREGDLLGFVGDTGSEGLVHLHLEVRRVRDEQDAAALTAGQLTAQDRTIAVDPRNVLPLRPAR